MNSTSENVSVSQQNSKIMEECLYFLHSTSCLVNVEANVMRYENIVEKHTSKDFLPRFHYPLEIDLSTLRSISDSLFNLLVNEPNMAMFIIHKALYTYILSKIQLDNFQFQQLHIPLRIKPGACLPMSKSINIPFGVLTLFQGSILSISTRTKYISSYVIKCGEENCPNGLGQREIGTKPTQMPPCCVCGNTMQEIPEAQEMEERIIGFAVQLPEMVNKVTSSVRRQCLTVCFQDDLMSAVEPGLKYDISGYKGIEYFHAMSLTPKFYLCNEITPKTIPNSICRLYHQVRDMCPDSPWAFVGSLASHFANNDYPASCYFNLKMGLLLSLASLRPEGKPVPVLAVGPDTHIAHRLMRKAAALRKRGTVLEWATSSPNGQLHWETSGSEELCWIEAGPLLLASGGVCCLGDWAKLKGKASQAVISALESTRITLDSNKAKSIPLPSFPLRCSVWTYMLFDNTATDSRKHHKKSEAPSQTSLTTSESVLPQSTSTEASSVRKPISPSTKTHGGDSRSTSAGSTLDSEKPRVKDKTSSPTTKKTKADSKAQGSQQPKSTSSPKPLEKGGRSQSVPKEGRATKPQITKKPDSTRSKSQPRATTTPSVLKEGRSRTMEKKTDPSKSGKSPPRSDEKQTFQELEKQLKQERQATQQLPKSQSKSRKTTTPNRKLFNWTKKDTKESIPETKHTSHKRSDSVPTPEDSDSDLSDSSLTKKSRKNAKSAKTVKPKADDIPRAFPSHGPETAGSSSKGVSYAKRDKMLKARETGMEKSATRPRATEADGGPSTRKGKMHKLTMITETGYTEILASLVPDEIIYNVHEKTYRKYDVCLLFGDASGFTDLCERYSKSGKGGPSRLTVVLNSFIGTMVQEIMTHGGDVLKFSGDAFLSWWKVNETLTSLQDAVALAIETALIIQKRFGKYETDVGVTLRVKLAISAGQVGFSSIGTDDTKHYIVLGRPVMDVKVAEYLCVAGDIMVTPRAWTYVNPQDYDHEYMPDSQHVKVLAPGVGWRHIMGGYEGAGETADTRQEDWAPDERGLGSILFMGGDEDRIIADVESLSSDEMEDDVGTEVMETARESTVKASQQDEITSLRPSVKYALKNNMKTILRPYVIKPVLKGLDMDEPIEYLTEMRQVVIVFTNLVTQNPPMGKMIRLVDKCYRIVCSSVHAHQGCVNKTSLFDKDLMFLIIFGLRGFKHELESQIALRCGAELYERLTKVNMVRTTSVGITTGMTYCGVVGHTLRREYSVIGPTVNKAARIMVAYPGRVTCDRETFLHSRLEASNFILQEHKELKGLQQAGPIYEFREHLLPRTTHVLSKFPLLSRDDELELFNVLFEESQHRFYPSKGSVSTFRDPQDRMSMAAEERRGTSKFSHVDLDKRTTAYFISGMVIRAEPRMGKSRLMDEMLHNGEGGGTKIARIALTPKDYQTTLFGINKILEPIMKFPENASKKEKEEIVLKLIKKVKTSYWQYLYTLNELFQISIDFKLTHPSERYKEPLTAMKRSLWIILSQAVEHHWVIGVDDLEFLDDASWELLPILLEKDFGFIVMTLGNRLELEQYHEDMLRKNKHLYHITLGGIDKWYHAALACQILDVWAIPPELERLLHERSRGNPGWVESYLVTQLQQKVIQVTSMTQQEADGRGLVRPPARMITRAAAKRANQMNKKPMVDPTRLHPTEDRWEMFKKCYHDSAETVPPPKDKEKDKDKDKDKGRDSRAMTAAHETLFPQIYRKSLREMKEEKEKEKEKEKVSEEPDDTEREDLYKRQSAKTIDNEMEEQRHVQIKDNSKSKDERKADAFLSKLRGKHHKKDKRIKSLTVEQLTAGKLIAVCILTPGAELLGEADENLTETSMMLKVFDSLTSYEQMLLKCASVLGESFMRKMLKSLMGEPDLRELAECVQKLFDMGVVTCASADQGGPLTSVSVTYNAGQLGDMHGASGIVACQCPDLDIDEVNRDLPVYASCSYMRFRMTTFRDMTYSLLTDSQKKEYHERAMRYLEQETRRCAACGRRHFLLLLGTRHEQRTIRRYNRKRWEQERALRRGRIDSITSAGSDASAGDTSSVGGSSLPGSSRRSSQEASGSPGSTGSHTFMQLVTYEDMLLNKIRQAWGDPDELPQSGVIDRSKAQGRYLPTRFPWSFLGFCQRRGSVPSAAGLSLTRSFSSFNFTECECQLILTTVYAQVLDHCRGAELDEKTMDALLEYAEVCVYSSNHAQAQHLLVEARKLLAGAKREPEFGIKKVDDLREGSYIPSWKWPYLMGRIHTLLGCSRLELGQYEEAHYQLHLAMAHMGVPFPENRFMLRAATLLTNMRLSLTTSLMARAWMGLRTGFAATYADAIASCLALMYVVFRDMGDWMSARLAATWGLIRSLESGLDFLGVCVSFANMLEVLQYDGNFVTCAKLEVGAMEVCRNRASYLEIQELIAVGRLYRIVFHSLMTRGRIESAISVGYKTLRIATAVHATHQRLDVLPGLIRCLIARNRVSEAVTLLNELEYIAEEDVDKTGITWYFALSMEVHLDTGYSVLPYLQCEEFFKREGESLYTGRNPQSSHRLYATLWLWCMRLEDWEGAKLWEDLARPEFSVPDLYSVRQYAVTTTFIMQGYSIKLAYLMDIEDREAVSETKKKIENLFALFRKACSYIRYAEPDYMAVKAYYMYLTSQNNPSKKKKALHALRSASEFAARQGNSRLAEWCKHNEKWWRGLLAPVKADTWFDCASPDNLVDWHEADKTPPRIMHFTLPLPSCLD